MFSNSRKINYKTEVIAGLTTFFTMSYIVIVNPAILSASGSGMSFSGVMTATVLLSFLLTLLMGLYARLPYAVAPGMGVNAFFTYTVILSQKVPWQDALGAVFWSGVLFLLVSATSLRVRIAKAIPENLKSAAAGGIGVFLVFIGLKNIHLIEADPETFVRVASLNFENVVALLSLLLMIICFKKKYPFTFLIGIFFVTSVAIFTKRIVVPETYFSYPDFKSVFLKLNILGSLKLSLLPTIVSIFFTDLFDSIATFIGVSKSSGLVEKNGDPLNLKEGLLVDALATLFAGLFGTSSGTAFIESTAGIEAGGRTGVTSVVTALCFLPCFFIAPLAGMIPSYATGSILIFVGLLMFKTVLELKADRVEEFVPALLTVILIPLTFSITQGILWGFIFHVILFYLLGRRKEISNTLLIIAIISLILISIR